MKDSRTKNTIRNINAGLINKISAIIFPFINRTALLWILGTEFTGLTSLFSSILSVLNVAELGFSSAIVYSLYEPIANNDEKRICELVSMFKKIYRVIGTVILVAGIAVMFFLRFFVNGNIPDTANIYLLYLLYLINSCIGYYLFAYKECMLIADQRNDIVDNIRTIINTIVYLVQLVILIFTRNFYLYLIVMIVGTIVTSLITNYQTKKRYPFYKEVSTEKKIPSDIKEKVSGLMIDRICDTFRNSFDSLIISSFIGLAATAIYTNYYYIYFSLYTIMLVICNAMSASVGNSIIKRSEKENYEDLLMFSQLFSWILGWSTVCLLCLYQPFMTLWVGKDLLLPNCDMILFCVYFYLINLNNIRNQYISGNGLWEKLKKSYIIEAGANLLLNIILGKIFGITGVIIATIITIFLFNYLQRNKVLFDNYFKNYKLSEFYKEQIYYAFLTTIIAIITYSICSNIILNNIISYIVLIIILITLPNVLFFLGLKITKRYKNSRDFIFHVVLKK